MLFLSFALSGERLQRTGGINRLSRRRGKGKDDGSHLCIGALSAVFALQRLHGCKRKEEAPKFLRLVYRVNVSNSASAERVYCGCRSVCLRLRHFLIFPMRGDFQASNAARQADRESLAFRSLDWHGCLQRGGELYAPLAANVLGMELSVSFSSSGLTPKNDAPKPSREVKPAMIC